MPLRPKVSEKFKDLKLLVTVTGNLRIFKLDFKPDFLYQAMVLV